MDNQQSSCFIPVLGFFMVACVLAGMVMAMVQAAPQSQGNQWQEEKMEATEDAYSVAMVATQAARGFQAVEVTTGIQQGSEAAKTVVPFCSAAVVAVCIVVYKALSRPVKTQQLQ
jgi:hypothetical protein